MGWDGMGVPGEPSNCKGVDHTMPVARPLLAVPCRVDRTTLLWRQSPDDAAGPRRFRLHAHRKAYMHVTGACLAGARTGALQGSRAAAGCGVAAVRPCNIVTGQ